MTDPLTVYTIHESENSYTTESAELADYWSRAGLKVTAQTSTGWVRHE